MVENYSNSRKLREEPKEEVQEEKKVQKVISGSAARRKPGLGKRFASMFVGGDGRSVSDYLLRDVLVPAFKDTVTTLVSQGVEQLIYGDVRGRAGGSRPAARGGAAYIPYNRVATPGAGTVRREEPRPQLSQSARAQHDFDEIVLESRADAEGVIDGLFEQLDRFQVTTVADLYELAGLRAEYTDRNWGWTDLTGASAVRVKGGYLLNLPRPIQL